MPPFLVVGSRGFCREHFLLRASLLLQRSNLRADLRQRVAKLDELRTIANWPVTRNDDGLRRCLREILFRRANHAVDASSRRAIDEGIYAVPPRVAGVKHIGLDEVNADVGVGVRGRIAPQFDRSAIQTKRATLVEHVGWNRARR